MISSAIKRILAVYLESKEAGLAAYEEKNTKLYIYIYIYIYLIFVKLSNSHKKNLAHLKEQPLPNYLSNPPRSNNNVALVL